VNNFESQNIKTASLKKTINAIKCKTKKKSNPMNFPDINKKIVDSCLESFRVLKSASGYEESEFGEGIHKRYVSNLNRQQIRINTKNDDDFFKTKLEKIVLLNFIIS
jgi:hypothetical protein